MGAGKSTVGRALAARLGLPFVDSEHAYAQSHIRVGTIAFSPEAVVTRIVEASSNASSGIGSVRS